MTDLHLFLGGHDLEMVTIGALGREALGAERVHDAGLGWGARASAYRDVIAAVAAAGGTPVLVELALDLPADLLAQAVVVDHHGERAGRDQLSALAQVFALLDLPPDRWTRELALVAANDVGHMPAMRAMGATDAEVRRIRDADRRAQGVTPADEAAARTAIAAAERRGALLVVRTTSFRTSPVADFLEPEYGGTPPPALLVLSPGEANVFAAGTVIRALADEPGGWWGGALPYRGFWGRRLSGDADAAAVVARVVRLASEAAGV